MRAGAQSASSYGSTKFFSLPLGAPSMGARLHVDLGGSENAYAVFLGRGCPSDPASFQCVATAQIECTSPACVSAGVLDYTFSEADTATYTWYLALTNTDHHGGSGGIRWRAEGKFLAPAALPLLSSPTPGAAPTPPLAGDASLRTMDLGGAFFAFGPGAGDATLGRSDEGALRLPLPLPLPAFSSYFDAAFVSTNGFVSLGALEGHASAPPLPRAREAPGIIAPLWADADTRAGSSASSLRPGAVPDNAVYARTAVRSSRTGGTAPGDALVLDTATARVRALFASAEGAFVAQMALVATWYAVAPWPAAVAAASGGGNSFQAVLVTDGVRSYALLAYAALGWAAGPGGPLLLSNGSRGWQQPGAPCPLLDSGGGLVGASRMLLPAGCGGAPSSAADLVSGLTRGSNVGAPGQFAFRIDTAAHSGGCAETSTQADMDAHASLSPRAGSQLGGTLVFLSGPCLPPGAVLTCGFGDVVVPARRAVPGSSIVACAAPFSPLGGDVNVTLGVADAAAGGGITRSFLGVFTYVRPDSHALPAVTLRSLAPSDTAAAASPTARSASCTAPPAATAPPSRSRAQLPPGISAYGDTLQVAWFVPADVVNAEHARSGGAALNFTLELLELKVGDSQPALCPGPLPPLTSARLPRGPLSSAALAPAVVVTALEPGATVGPAGVWLTPDVPPDDAGLRPSRYLVTAHLPAPYAKDACLHLLFVRVRLGAQPDDPAQPLYAESTLVSGLLPLLGTARPTVSSLDDPFGAAFDLSGLCAAGRALLPLLADPRTWAARAGAAGGGGVLGCPIDRRDAQSAPGAWLPEAGCPAAASGAGALTLSADALSAALPTAWPPAWANTSMSWMPVPRSLPAPAGESSSTLVLQARKLLPPALQPCAMQQGRSTRGESSASACFLSTSSQQLPAAAVGGFHVAARCCYDRSHALIRAGPGAGHYLAASAAALVAPSNAWLTVVLWYDLARLLCCGAGGGTGGCGGVASSHSGVNDAACDALLGDHPPSVDGDGGSSGGGSWNDPHWTTLSGGIYTYNGLGAHLLAAAPLTGGALVGGSPGQLARATLGGDTAAGAGAWQVWVLLEALPPPAEPLAAVGGANVSRLGLRCSGGPAAARAVSMRAGVGPRVEVRLPPLVSGGRSLQVLVDGEPLRDGGAAPSTVQWPRGVVPESLPNRLTAPLAPSAAGAAGEIASASASVEVSADAEGVTVAWPALGLSVHVSSLLAAAADGGAWAGTMLQTSLAVADGALARGIFGLIGGGDGGGALVGVDGLAAPPNASEREVARIAGGWRAPAAAWFAAPPAADGASGTGGTSWEPTFSDELVATALAAEASGTAGWLLPSLQAMCGGAAPGSAGFRECLLDAVCTADERVGAATAAVSAAWEALRAVRAPRPVFNAALPRLLLLRAGEATSIDCSAAPPPLGGSLTYALAAAPLGARIDAGSGRVSLPPADGAVWGQVLRVTAVVAGGGLPAQAEIVLQQAPDASAADGAVAPGTIVGAVAAVLSVAALLAAAVAASRRRARLAGEGRVKPVTAPKDPLFSVSNPMARGGGNGSNSEQPPAPLPPLRGAPPQSSMRGHAFLTALRKAGSARFASFKPTETRDSEA